MAYISKAQATRRVIDISKRTDSIALDGSAVRVHLHTAEKDAAVRLIRVTYEEATSSDTGVAIKVGKIGFPDFYALFTSESSKAAGSVTTVTKFANRELLLANETLTVDCVGGKTGTGIVAIQVEMESYR